MALPARQNRKKGRKTAHLAEIPHKYYIFCEGEQTEPLYFKGFKESIESNPVYRNLVHIELQGVGAETLRVLDAAKEFVQKEAVHNAQIWCVYDKDSFPSQNFNAVSREADNLNRISNDVRYCVAWSNQCIEYWFILHFAYYDADNDRKYYRRFLHKKLKELGWTKYEKNNAELFRIMTEKGNPKLAIRLAKRRMEECQGLTDSESAPATRVYALVQELAPYLPDELRARYL